MGERSMLGEKILLWFSKKYYEPDYNIEVKSYNIDNALDRLVSAFGLKFLENIKDKSILDYGCGGGFQVIAMALSGAKYVIGLDNRDYVFKDGINLSKEKQIETKVRFITSLEHNQKFDIIVSQNSFEHYSNPYNVLKEWIMLLKNEGKIYITFGPPWYAPFGSHTRFFTKLPWVNILFCESTVMKVRSRFRNDGAKFYYEVDGGLNKMTVKKAEEILRASGLELEYINYTAVKKMNILVKIPYLRELFINNIDCVLRK